MKTVLVASLLLASSITFANDIEIEYTSYKDLMMRPIDEGSYTWTSQCKYNDIFWNKEKKNYKRVVTSDTAKGTDIVEINGDSIRTITHSVDSTNVKMFMESNLTFTGENTYTKTTKRKFLFEDGSTSSSTTYIEAEHKNGKFVVSKYVVNGEEKQISSGVSTSVWLDKNGYETIDSYSLNTIQSKIT